MPPYPLNTNPIETTPYPPHTNPIETVRSIDISSYDDKVSIFCSLWFVLLSWIGRCNQFLVFICVSLRCPLERRTMLLLIPRACFCGHSCAAFALVTQRTWHLVVDIRYLIFYPSSRKVLLKFEFSSLTDVLGNGRRAANVDRIFKHAHSVEILSTHGWSSTDQISTRLKESPRFVIKYRYDASISNDRKQAMDVDMNHLILNSFFFYHWIMLPKKFDDLWVFFGPVAIARPPLHYTLCTKWKWVL